MQCWLHEAGSHIKRLRESVGAASKASPFAATPLLVALEKLATDWDSEAVKVPLVGTIQGEDSATIERSVESLLEFGYGTLKLKLFGAVAIDCTRIQTVRKVLRGRARVRVDANEAYTYESASETFDKLDPDYVELLEQPLPRQDWDGIERLARRSSVPLMLDESIWTEADVVRAASIPGVEFVKLKLVKHGSMARTYRLARLALEHGLDVVLGNGIQTDLGCYDEASVYHQASLSLAGELNGFLKSDHPIATPTPRLEEGIGVFPRTPAIDWNAIHRFAIDQAVVQFGTG